jgi:hypothetical protein
MEVTKVRKAVLEDLLQISSALSARSSTIP